VVGLDLLELLDDSRVVCWKTANAAERLVSLVELAGPDEIARSLGKEEHAAEENERPGELNGDGNAVAARIVTLASGIVNDSSEEETDGDGPLVGTDDGTTNPLGSGLGLVEGNCGGIVCK
jgi:hypothetical protein